MAPPSPYSTAIVSAVQFFRFLGSTYSQEYLKWTSNIDTLIKKARAEDILPALLCNHLVCALHFHHCLVWFGHQTEQEQTTPDCQDCRDLEPTCPSVQDLSTSRVKSTGRKHPLQTQLTLDTTPCQLLPSGRRYRALKLYDNQTQKQLLPTGHHSDEHFTCLQCQEQSQVDIPVNYTVTQFRFHAYIFLTLFLLCLPMNGIYS